MVSLEVLNVLSNFNNLMAPTDYVQRTQKPCSVQQNEQLVRLYLPLVRRLISSDH